MKKKFLLKLYLSETVFIIMIFVINYIIKIKRFIYSIKWIKTVEIIYTAVLFLNLITNYIFWIKKLKIEAKRPHLVRKVSQFSMDQRHKARS